MQRRIWVFVLCLSPTASADPVLVERVVARVEGKPIYLSEIRARARPVLESLRPVERAAAFRSTHRRILDERIERELLLSSAARDHLEVAPDEVERALESIAKASSLDVAAMLDEARRAGFDGAAYREEIREQLLEQRVIQAYGLEHLAAYPATDAARTAWMAKARKLLLRELRRQTWTERWSRW